LEVASISKGYGAHGQSVLLIQVPVDARNKRHKSRLLPPFMLFHHFSQMFHFPLRFDCVTIIFRFVSFNTASWCLKIKRKIIFSDLFHKRNIMKDLGDDDGRLWGACIPQKKGVNRKRNETKDWLKDSYEQHIHPQKSVYRHQ
jgi:hypothetical protein